jgi:hypothetical protein
MKRYLYTDPRTRKEVSLHQNSDGSSVIEQRQEFGDLLKINKQMAGDYQPGSMIGNTQRHLQHVAEIPNVVYNHLLERFGPIRENPKAWKAWLNDSENQAFRTGGGRL